MLGIIQMLWYGSFSLSASLSLIFFQLVSLFWAFAHVHGRPCEGGFLGHSSCESNVNVKRRIIMSFEAAWSHLYAKASCQSTVPQMAMGNQFYCL